jgi:hypothetical protein
VNVGRFAVAVAAWSPAPERDRPRFEGLLKRVEAALQAATTTRRTPRGHSASRSTRKGARMGTVKLREPLERNRMHRAHIARR